MNFRFFCGIGIVSMLASGCVSTQPPSRVSNLQIKVAQLERKLDERDALIKDLKHEVKSLNTQVSYSSKESRRSSSKRVVNMDRIMDDDNGMGRHKKSKKKYKEDAIIRVDVSAKVVQRSLKRSGYYTGKIDGKIGRGTKKAIRSFQKDHDLNDDGIIGQKTWSALKAYLE